MVLESVNKLKTKNSAGKDNISTKFPKDIIESIIYPALLICLISRLGLDTYKVSINAPRLYLLF